MESKLGDFEQEPVVRPTLLTVLCILTFIGSSWTIASNIWSYSMAHQTVKMFSESGISRQDDSTLQNDGVDAKTRQNRGPLGQKMMLSVSKMMTVVNIRKSAIGMIISGLFTLAGGILMWRLRRTGFYLYILGIVIGIVVPFYLYGNNLLAVGISSFSNFFGLVFIALYALNIKSMRR